MLDPDDTLSLIPETIKPRRSRKSARVVLPDGNGRTTPVDPDLSVGHKLTGDEFPPRWGRNPIRGYTVYRVEPGNPRCYLVK
jgi:hypothetical protein